MSQAETAYVPGVCNINREEIAKRRKTGHAGLTVFIVIATIMVLLNISRYYRIILFLPAFLAATGYLQARNKFCVGYAAAGQQNADEGSTKASVINDETALAADKRRARTMNLQAAGYAVVLTIIAVAIPHL